MANLQAIRTRNQLHGMLAEAAELEHNLMCLYLYAVFSLKTEAKEGLSDSEVKMVKSWRETIMGVCIQEMSHLALVSNLSTATGGNAHMFRTNFPIKSGYFPSDFVMELTPFDMKTLDHFIFLERSSDSTIEDSEQEAHDNYVREAPKDRLMTHGGDYSTVGDLYECIRNGIVYLGKELGKDSLFCGDIHLQLTGEDVSIEGMRTIFDEASALQAIDRIVDEGEGGSGGEKSHFQKFKDIKKQYRDALSKNPDFSPSRACARNPVMRKPVGDQNVLWVNHPETAPILDIVNAIYDLMVRCLTLLYSGDRRSKADRDGHLSLTFDLMKSLALSASFLTTLDANIDHPGIKAGVSFATSRHFLPPLVRNENLIIGERIEELLIGLDKLPAQLASILRGKLEPHYQRLL